MSIQSVPTPFIPQVTGPQEVGVFPSKEQAKATFWGLGDRFWMQMIDGKFHAYGEDVFDEGRHGGEAERGFFGSLKKGCEFAGEHFTENPTIKRTEDLTIQFYKDLHKKMCSHFKGKENNTEVSADATGVFRSYDAKAHFYIPNICEESWKHYLVLEIHQRSLSETTELPSEEYSNSHQECSGKHSFKVSIEFLKVNPEWVKNWTLEWANEKNIKQKIDSQFAASKTWVAQWEEHWANQVEKINQYVLERCSSMKVYPFVSISKATDKFLTLEYWDLSASDFDRIGARVSGNYSEGIEKIVQVLFDRYNQKIAEINLRFKGVCTEDQEKQRLEEKIEAIADLYQQLEWLHPFYDGQGRTDLVLQAKLLSEEGANPAILEEPYFSSFNLLPEWKKYLLNGMECWKIQRG